MHLMDPTIGHCNKHSVEKSIEHPVEHSSEHPLEHSSGHPVEQTVEHPIEHSIHQSIERSTKHSAEHLVEPVNRAIEHSIVHPEAMPHLDMCALCKLLRVLEARTCSSHKCSLTWGRAYAWSCTVRMFARVCTQVCYTPIIPHSHVHRQMCRHAQLSRCTHGTHITYPCTSAQMS